MSNRINDIVTKLGDSHGITIRDIARMCGVTESTLYKICGKETLDNVSILVFLKVAHGLGLSAEELYYGHSMRTEDYTYLDPREAVIHGAWEHLSEDRKDALAGIARDMKAASLSERL